jgi:UDP-N-acetylmuramyl pentapeptide phosphotransferase/UDP-N-acetylglucosamine-1-phosphate transferase
LAGAANRCQTKSLEYNFDIFISSEYLISPMEFLYQLPYASYVAFGVAISVSLLLVLTKSWHGKFSLDFTQGIQKFHIHPTPRVGGIAIVAGVVAAYVTSRPERQAFLGPLLLAGVPAFVFGLAEDVTKKVSVTARLLATMLSGLLGWLITGVSITHVDLPIADDLLRFGLISILFTAFAIGGVANAINVIDGFHGLASGMVLLGLAGVAWIAMQVGDINLAYACVAIAAAMFGFFLVNWPLGKIFLGDGGSYFGGFALAWVAVLMVERNTQVTPFAALLICIYPVTEVLFSIYRRRLKQAHPGAPDKQHLHSLIMRRYVRRKVPEAWQNPVTGLVLAMMTLPAVLMAFYFQGSAQACGLTVLVLMLGYVTLYARIVRHHWCSPISFLFLKPSY